MSITWTKVATFPFVTVLGCASKGITCCGNAKMVAAIEEEEQTPNNKGVLRALLSTDNGQTWAEELPNLVSANSEMNSKLRSPGIDQLLAGMIGPISDSTLDKRRRDMGLSGPGGRLPGHGGPCRFARFQHARFYPHRSVGHLRHW
jgi:hypothetical protein